MSNQFYRSVDMRGMKAINQTSVKNHINDGKTLISGKNNDDLVIEENTIYEIDRECHAKNRKQRKFK